MHLSLIYRHPLPEYHSIENIFDTLAEYLPDDVVVNKVYAKYKSVGLLNRIKNVLYISKKQADINHITGYDHFLAPFLKKNKTILTIHDVGSIKYGNPLKKQLLKLFWFTLPVKSVAYVTVISEFTKKELLNYTGIDENKIVVIPNCVSPKFLYHKKIFNKQKPVILHIGTKANKNLLRLIQALKYVNSKLIIVGKLNEQQKTLLSTNNIEYENYFNISNDELVELYKKADILSFVSTYEGFGMPVIEANAVGCPVITSNIEPLNQLAANAALKVNPLSVEEIRQAISKIITDDTLRNNLIQNGLENAKKYSAHNIAMQYYKLYNQLLNKQ
ncbi:MAG: glycosyltransferase family 4 protein [Bacteroidales bacterium]|nr:glycosyltransferase family 4 protein [Bacteroidales bacterium]